MDVRMAGSRIAVARRFGQGESVVTGGSNNNTHSAWIFSHSESSRQNVSRSVGMFPNTRPFSFPNCV